MTRRHYHLWLLLCLVNFVIGFAGYSLYIAGRNIGISEGIHDEAIRRARYEIVDSGARTFSTTMGEGEHLVVMCGVCDGREKGCPPHFPKGAKR